MSSPSQVQLKPVPIWLQAWKTGALWSKCSCSNNLGRSPLSLFSSSLGSRLCARGYRCVSGMSGISWCDVNDGVLKFSLIFSGPTARMSVAILADSG